MEVFFFILIAIVSILARAGKRQKEEEARRKAQRPPAAPSTAPPAAVPSQQGVPRSTLQAPPRPVAASVRPEKHDGGPWFDPAPSRGQGRQAQGTSRGSAQGKRFQQSSPAQPDYYGEGRLPAAPTRAPMVSSLRAVPNAPALTTSLTPASGPARTEPPKEAGAVRTPLIQSLSFQGNALVYGMLYGEILGKPKALRGPKHTSDPRRVPHSV